MEASQIYIAMALVALAIVAILVFFVKKEKKKRLSRLAAIAFAFIVAGIVFGEDRLVGYSLMGIGVVIAVIDIITKLKNSK